MRGLLSSERLFSLTNYLIKVNVGDNSGNSSVSVFVRFSSIEDIVFTNSNQQIGWRDVFDTMSSRDNPIVGQKCSSALVSELPIFPLSQGYLMGRRGHFVLNKDMMKKDTRRSFMHTVWKF